MTKNVQKKEKRTKIKANKKGNVRLEQKWKYDKIQSEIEEKLIPLNIHSVYLSIEHHMYKYVYI